MVSSQGHDTQDEMSQLHLILLINRKVGETLAELPHGPEVSVAPDSLHGNKTSQGGISNDILGKYENHFSVG